MKKKKTKKSLYNQLVPDDTSGAYYRESDPEYTGHSLKYMNTRTEFSKGFKVDVITNDLEKKLIDRIWTNSKYQLFGCVAWLTSFEIIGALIESRTSSQIIVQKEDFLRPDIGIDPLDNMWKINLRNLYGLVENKLLRHDMPGICSDLSVCGDPGVDAIRCMGNHNSEKKAAHPRMHNKFALWCEVIKDEITVTDEMARHGIYNEYKRPVYVPKALWTGSYNWTINSGFSLENAIYIEGDNDELDNIYDPYLNMFSNCFALSEPLNWEVPWCCPEWRIGT